MPSKPKPAAQPAAPAAPVSPFEKARPWLHAMVALVAALIVWNTFQGAVSRTDFWWHLKTGQYIVQQHRLPVPDPFSYTTYMGKPAYPGEDIARYFNLTHEWLAQVIFCWIYSLGGAIAIQIFRQLTITVLCALIGHIVYRRTGGFHRAVFAGVVAAPAIQFLTGDRPYLITYLLLGVTLWVLERRKPLWILPPMFLFWANCHSGFFLGWIAVGAYVAEALYQRWKGKPAADERRLFLAMAAGMLASGLNPNGYRVFQVLVFYRNSPLQNRIFEWHPPRLIELTPFTCLLYTGIVVAALCWRKVRIPDWLIFAIFAAAAVSAARNVVLIGIFAPIVIFSYLPGKWKFPPVFEACVLVFLACLCWLRFPLGPMYRAEGWDLPKEMTDFLVSHHVRGRMFNVYDEGTYLIWRLAPEVPVFQDGRALNESVFADGVRIQQNATAQGGPSGAELLDRYGIDLIVMPMLNPMGDAYYLPIALSDPAQKTWKLIYRDLYDVVFVRNVPPGVTPLNSLEALNGMEMECRNALDHGEYSRCALTVSNVFRIAGDPAKAAQWMATYKRSELPDTPFSTHF